MLLQMTMRSVTGCWTCRLRRKKCDEQQPFCRTCEMRGVVCNGYGSRPDWMDRGEKERRASERLSRATKMAVGRRRDGEKKANMMENVLEVSFVANEFYIKGGRSKPSDESITWIPQTHKPSQRKAHNSSSLISEERRGYHSSPQHQHLTGDKVSPMTYNEGFPIPSIPSPTQEATLLMHYLDNIFPVQFRFYDPSQSPHGRGWLFSLLTQTKPVYHAALSLSAYYFYLSMPLDSVERDVWHQEVERHHILALNCLQQSIEELNTGTDASKLESAIGALACIGQFICFEWSRGGLENWQIHLHAASTLLPILTNYLDTLELSSQIPTHSANLTMTVRYLVVLFLRFDALSCISTGKQPIFRDGYTTLLESPNSKIQMQDFVGCKNWVMTLILDTAELDEWKRKTLDCGKLSTKELVRKAAQIEIRLEKEIDDNLALMKDLVQTDEKTTRNSYSYNSSQITNIFAYGTLIYLHVIVSGWNPDLAEVQKSVARAIFSLKSLPDKKLLSSLTWPFCIAGCVARREDEFFFRTMVTEAGSNDSCVGNLWNAFKVMEKCWSKRDDIAVVRRGSEWRDIMRFLGSGLLLI